MVHSAASKSFKKGKCGGGIHAEDRSSLIQESVTSVPARPSDAKPYSDIFSSRRVQESGEHCPTQTSKRVHRYRREWVTSCNPVHNSPVVPQWSPVHPGWWYNNLTHDSVQTWASYTGSSLWIFLHGDVKLVLHQATQDMLQVGYPKTRL